MQEAYGRPLVELRSGGRGDGVRRRQQEVGQSAIKGEDQARLKRVYQCAARQSAIKGEDQARLKRVYQCAVTLFEVKLYM
jgi:molybdenum-dependent DNA-binding transcriptional regulator ModE